MSKENTIGQNDQETLRFREAVADVVDAFRLHHLRNHSVLSLGWLTGTQEEQIIQMTEATRLMFGELTRRYGDSPQLAERIGLIGATYAYTDSIPEGERIWIENVSEEVFTNPQGGWALSPMQHVLIARIFPEVNQQPAEQRRYYIQAEASTMLSEMHIQPVQKRQFGFIGRSYIAYPFDRFIVAQSLLQPNGLQMPRRAISS